ncbi:MAG: methyltransferase domain-containing protein [Patescibacteria group bacterium]
MFKSGKESGDYLRQIGNSVPEKIGVIEKSLNDSSLPKTADGKIRIIELGIGGGESLKRLKKNSSSGVELIAVDIIPKLVASIKKETGVDAVAADAGTLPFADMSISAINASAIFHEISSYGIGSNLKDGGNLYGKDAIIRTLGEFNRVLLPEGKIAYRDVLAPSENLMGGKKVNYSHKSWRLYANWFLRDFVNPSSRFYKNINPTIDEAEDGFALTAPVGFQRDFQRHYIMLRDYLRNVKQKEFGLTMVRSDWLDEKQGLKSVTFSLDERLGSIIDLSGFEVHDSMGEKIYRGNSDQFDKIYDDLMEYYFTQLNSGSVEGKIFAEIINTWKEREGLENYIYGNIIDILDLSYEATKSSNSEWVLFPESTSDIETPLRFYYNRYLKGVVDYPEQDGKQIISFKKMKRDQALDSLNKLMESPWCIKNLGVKEMEKLRVKIEQLK